MGEGKEVREGGWRDYKTLGGMSGGEPWPWNSDSIRTRIRIRIRIR